MVGYVRSVFMSLFDKNEKWNCFAWLSVYLLSVASVSLASCSMDSEVKYRQPQQESTSICEAIDVLEPRKCKVNCYDGFRTLYCSGEIGAATVSQPGNISECEWASSWNDDVWVIISENSIESSNAVMSNTNEKEIGQYITIKFGYQCMANRNNMQTVGGEQETGNCDGFLRLLNEKCNGTSRLYSYERP